ncbi:protein containing duf1501 : Uncharacterized protein OS=Pirellula staleyi (strain ATCC 27377 / DSM 6068 / ICPB 4128) GN=Psta_0183 PE=4 SV=1: DUF1501 [Gemmataceae bacterium]|nr:protein containing duf1501 : Uncharacterized protein OS=Pirellula staleyi (strain ATCC 27377 / DSM 6068 / ICPB 4128) GN=Psta_0183 PE=4 SV=1: DUF1501 [Gemmataceae bacterium]VTT98320.1 protein containing duf1501 : Uncharacterized protein OS=Pirellula staleyi (strain ATCC 27377 / DSM 6068 / ICPB 4128) GN=Psta_0183 PE=4 SV=1: DUF1501 [Gemmataceae bacterium]
MTFPHYSRREMLTRCGAGMGALGLAQLLGTSGQLTAHAKGADGLNPLAPKKPHFPAKAKHVIHIFANGGPSQVDTFDPKPALEKYAGKPLPAANLKTERRTGAAFPSPFKFQKYGQSGLEVSEIFAHTAKHIDDICVIRSMHADVPNHEPSFLLMNCGEPRQIRPSVGSWVTYGLGTENQNLPGFVAMCPGGFPLQEAQNWQAGFLPGIFQGSYVDTRNTDVEKLVEFVKNKTAPGPAQRKQLDLLAKLNAAHQAERPNDPQLEARIQSFELAYRMQSEASEAFDVSREPKHVLEAYGPGDQARSLLLARRLVERGVRFVQLSHGPVQPWDSHDDLEKEHRRLAGQVDKAIAALISDLKRLGLFEETLIIWGGEFGRTPVVELPTPGSNAGKVNGRDHNHWGFTVWMAGGGVKGGQAVGATDEFGFKAVENPVHVHDLHATILWLLGFDHEKFTYRYAGRDFRLTDVKGNVVKQVLA